MSQHNPDNSKPQHYTSSSIQVVSKELGIPVGKIAKKQSEGVPVFVNSALKIQCYIVSQKYTSTDRFFGDFAHWVGHSKHIYRVQSLLMLYA